MTTADERAEQINDLVIWLETCLANPTLREARGLKVPVLVTLAMSIENVQYLHDELKQAKLDRAKLALITN